MFRGLSAAIVLSVASTLFVPGITDGQSRTVSLIIEEDALNSVTLSGTGLGLPIVEQGPGSLSTILSGSLAVQVNFYDLSLILPGGSDLTFSNNGNWQPLPGGGSGSAPANLAGMVDLGSGSPNGLFAIREGSVDVSTGFTGDPLYGSTSAFEFSHTGTASWTDGRLDFRVPLSGGGVLASSVDLTGSGGSTFGIGTLVAEEDGWQFTLPVGARINFSSLAVSAQIEGMLHPEKIDLDASLWKGNAGGAFAQDDNWLGDPAPTANSIAAIYQSQSTPITFESDHVIDTLAIRGDVTLDLGGHTLDAGYVAIFDQSTSIFDRLFSHVTLTNGNLRTSGFRLRDIPTGSTEINSLTVEQSASFVTESSIDVDHTQIVVGGRLEAQVIQFRDRYVGSVLAGGVIVANQLTNRGQLTVDGTIISDVTLRSGFFQGNGTLSGEFTVDGDIIVASGGRLSPGNCPGTGLIFGDLSFEGGSLFRFEMNDAEGVAGGTNGWDLADVAGAVNLSGPILIELFSLDPLNQPGAPSNFDPNQNYTWQFLTSSEGIVGFDPSLFSFDTAYFLGAELGIFSVTEGTGGLFLHYTAIPEMSSVLLITAALGLGACRIRSLRRSG